MLRIKNPFFYLAALGLAGAFYPACSPAASQADDDNFASTGGSKSGDGDSIGDGDFIGDGDSIGDGDFGDISQTPNSGALTGAFKVQEDIQDSEMAAFDDPMNFTPGSVCVFEPHLSDANGVGALYPMNWLRPRFRWTGSGSETLWEIRLSAASQSDSLRIFTRQTEWKMPKEMWETIAEGVVDDITVTIRGNAGGSVVGMSGTFRVVPALAGGSMVFWGTTGSEVAPGASGLYGFTMGDEAVVNTLEATQVQSVEDVFAATGKDLRGSFRISATEGDYVEGFEYGGPRCIGCHTNTPDGKGMIFTDDYPWNLGIASVEAGNTGGVPDFVTPQALEFLKMPFLGTGMMLPTAFENGDRTLITTRGRREDAAVNYVYINYGSSDPPTYEPNVHDLIWIDLATTASVSSDLPPVEGDLTLPYDDWYTGNERDVEAQSRGAELLAAEGTAWGVLISEAGSISNPTPAKTANRIAYTVSESSYDGHPDWHNNTADVKIADIANPQGTATGMPLAGASDPNFLEYYPAFSPDDALVAFTRAPAPTNTDRCAEGKNIDRTNDGAGKCANSPRAQLGANPDGPYYNANGEIYIVSSAGGEPHRLRGNDPVMCSGESSPGVINSWPKWSSTVREANGKHYYFVIFSSARGYQGQFELEPTANTPPIDKRSSQLYMSVVEVDPATGGITSYAPIYLWNQNYLVDGSSPDGYVELKTANLTPVWEDFTIPEVPPEIIVR